MSDEGYFGPDTMFWQVNQEMHSLFGGARALLMQAAHPLVSAGARQTAFYARDPWKRLIRTVQLQLILAFGSKEEATVTAERVNKLHETINGIDPVTGLRYDALDLDLLLWVHATLEESTLLFFEKTVRPLSPAEREQYHHENLISAELILLPREHVPPTYPESSRTSTTSPGTPNEPGFSRRTSPFSAGPVPSSPTGSAPFAPPPGPSAASPANTSI